MQPKVSMVVPCYNKVLYIGEFFQSVHDQKWDNIELILVNDGSNDGTRDVIGEWVPRLRDRGYSVQVIDQPNLGVSAAVKNGLELVTGDFFCVPDCDDILSLEYVSKMAEVLIANDDIARVICDCDTHTWIFDNGKGLKRDVLKGLSKYRLNLINASFLSRIAHSFWLNMIRVNCLPQLISAFQIDFKESQEPQSCAMLGYIGSAAYLPENLYKYRHDVTTGINQSLNDDDERLFTHLRMYYNIGKETLKLLPLDGPTRSNFFGVADLGYAFYMASYGSRLYLAEESCLDAIHVALSNLTIPLKCESLNLENNRWRILERSVSNYLIGYDNPFQGKSYTLNPKGRIIGYGAYGMAAKELLHLVSNTPLKPTVLWDRAQGPSDIMGIPVTKPDLTGLTPGDTVLVFMRNRTIAAEVCDMLTASATDNILYYYDILDYLADFYFPLQLD